MKLMARLAAIVAMVASAVSCSSGDDVPVPELREGTVTVTTREQASVSVTALAPIKLGKNDLAVAPAAAGTEIVQASALMPAHGHGTQPPAIQRTATGFQVTGLVLYMSGRWELRLALKDAGGKDDEALLTLGVP